MKRIPRLFLFGALALILITAACSSKEETPQIISISTATIDLTLTATAPVVGTQTQISGTETMSAAATTATDTPTVDLTPTDTPQTQGGIPVTGSNIQLLDCQFCIDNMAQAMLVLPETATFRITNPSTSGSTTNDNTGCRAVDTFNGRQVVLCRGQENTSLNLNICTADNNCQQVLVKLQPCPLSQNGTPVANTPQPGSTPTDTPTTTGTDTPTAAASPTATP